MADECVTKKHIHFHTAYTQKWEFHADLGIIKNKRCQVPWCALSVSMVSTILSALLCPAGWWAIRNESVQWFRLNIGKPENISLLVTMYDNSSINVLIHVLIRRIHGQQLQHAVFFRNASGHWLCPSILLQNKWSTRNSLPLGFLTPDSILIPKLCNLITRTK